MATTVGRDESVSCVGTATLMEWGLLILVAIQGYVVL